MQIPDPSRSPAKPVTELWRWFCGLGGFHSTRGKAASKRRRAPKHFRAAFSPLEDRRLLSITAFETPPSDSGLSYSELGMWDAVDEHAMLGGQSMGDEPEYYRPADELFNWGDGGYPILFGPTLIRAKSGALIAIAEGRHNAIDSNSYALVMRRSTDNGVTWSPITTIYTDSFINSGSPVLDEVTGEIFFVFTKSVSTVLVISSTDDGVTWSAPRDITYNVKVTGPDNPPEFSDAYTGEPWGWYAIGPGHGIQMKHGPHAGRLILPADHRYTAGTGGISWSHIIYSDDHGKTWHLGGGVSETRSANYNSNECVVVETNTGDLYMSIRVNRTTLNQRGYSRSTDGGMTWTEVQREPVITSPAVQGSLLRVNDGLILFAASDSIDNTRRQMTIWASYDETQTWVKKKVLYFGYAGYNDLAVISPDTIMLVYNRGHFTNKYSSFQKIGVTTFTLDWLESDDPYEFSWYFNEAAQGQPANIFGTSIRDYSRWDNRAWPRSNDAPPMYVAAQGGETALALTAGSDHVLMTPETSQALHMEADTSMTIQLVMRTTADSGVILGTRPGIKNWSLQVVNGKLQFSLTDLVNSPTIVSSTPINDGNWHHIAVVRDAATRQLRMYVDRIEAATPVADTTAGTLRSDEGVTLGAFNDGTGQLAIDVDTLRVTRAVVAPGAFLPADFVSPLPLPPPTYSDNAPTSIPGLKFWLPQYDPTRFFADFGFSDPLPLVPRVDDAIHSAIDASGYRWQMTTPSHLRYGYDALIGPHWQHPALSDAISSSWKVWNSNGTQPNNFDFVQNTGKFTISTFINMGNWVSTSAYVNLFDTAEGAAALPGFTLHLLSDGKLDLLVSDGDGTPRWKGNAPTPPLQRHRWYHIAVVGSGKDQPLEFYLTPINSAELQSYTTSQPLIGEDGNYPTDAEHNLVIAGRARVLDRAFNGRMLNQTIYDRPLSRAEIQQLFDFGTEFETPPALTPSVTSVTTNEDTQTSSNLLISRNPGNGDEVTHFRINNIGGGTLYLHDGVTRVNNGDFITLLQGTTGLKFTPTPNSSNPGSFQVWSSKSSTEEGVGGDPATATITVRPVNDAPTFLRGSDIVNDPDDGPQVVPGWATDIDAGAPNEASQTLHFEVSNNNPGLFTVQPTLAADGTLRFTPAIGSSGSAVVTAVLKDDGGRLNGGVDASAPQTFIITIGTILRIEGDQNGEDQDDVIRVQRNGQFLDFFINNSTFIPDFSENIEAINHLSIRGHGGNDTLILDWGAGSVIPIGGLSYDGGEGSDGLQIINAVSSAARYVPRINTPGSGSVTIDGENFIFSNIEPLHFADLQSLTVVTPLADDDLVIDDLGNGINQLSGTSSAAEFEPVQFSNIGSLVLDTRTNDRSGGTDSIVVNGANVSGAGRLVLDTGTGVNAFRLNGGAATIVAPSGSNLDVTATGGILSVADSQTFRSLTMRNNATLSVAAGEVLLTIPRLWFIDNGGTVDVGEGSSINAGSVVVSIGAGSTLTKQGLGTLDISGPQAHGVGSHLVANTGVTNFWVDGGNFLETTIGGTVNFHVTQHLASLMVGPGGLANVVYGDEEPIVLRTSQLEIDPAGRVELDRNTLIVQSILEDRDAVLAMLSSYLFTGCNEFLWNGFGISSAAAANDPDFITALGVLVNDDGLGNPIYLGIDGESVDQGSIIVRYTRYGDADLGGTVDGTDYALIDNGNNVGLSGWMNGDFDHNGVVDGQDYALIDNSYNMQGVPLGVRSPQPLPVLQSYAGDSSDAPLAGDEAIALSLAQPADELSASASLTAAVHDSTSNQAGDAVVSAVIEGMASEPLPALVVGLAGLDDRELPQDLLSLELDDELLNLLASDLD